MIGKCYTNLLDMTYCNNSFTGVCMYCIEQALLVWSWEAVHTFMTFIHLILFLFFSPFQRSQSWLCFVLLSLYLYILVGVFLCVSEVLSKVTRSSNCNSTKYKVTKRITVTVHARGVKTEIEGQRDGKWKKREDYKGFLKQQATANLSITRISFLTR